MIVPFHVTEMLRRVLARYDSEETPRQMAPKEGDLPEVRSERQINKASIETLWSRLKRTASDEDQALIADPATVSVCEAYSRNIENFIGTVKVPMGVIGPLRLNGLNANGDFYVPLATSEAPLP